MADTRTLVLTALAGACVLALAAPFAAYAQPGLLGADRGLVVLTGSMEPAIAPGDVVLVEESPIEDVEVGDVVTFHPHEGVDRTNTHRVVEITEDRRGTILTTQGDANDRPDPMPVDEDMLVGTVEHRIPLLGKAIVGLQDAGPLALVALSVLTVGYEASNLLRGTRSNEGSPGPDRRFQVEGTRRRFQVVKRR